MGEVRTAIFLMKLAQALLQKAGQTAVVALLSVAIDHAEEQQE